MIVVIIAITTFCAIQLPDLKRNGRKVGHDEGGR